MEKKWYHFRFKGICGHNVNNRRKYLISFAAVFFVGEERLNVSKQITFFL